MSVTRMMCGAILSVAAMDARAGGAIAIPAQVPFAPDFTISDAARAECDLQKVLANDLNTSLNVAGYPVTVKEGLTEKSPGRALLLEFGSGMSTGHAMDTYNSRVNILTVNGCLYDEGKVVATFMDTRFSTGGVGGEFKKTCAILHKVEQVMADDITQWLANPPMFATLGDAHRGAGADIQFPPNTPPFCMMSGKLSPEMKSQWMAEHPKK